MPLTVNTWTGPNGGSFGDDANWSLGHVPTVTEWAVINAAVAAPSGDGGFSGPVGQFTVDDASNDANYDFQHINVAGDLLFENFHADIPEVRMSIGDVGGNVSFIACNAIFLFHALTGVSKSLTTDSGPIDLDGLLVPASYSVSGNIINYTQQSSSSLLLKRRKAYA